MNNKLINKNTAYNISDIINNINTVFNNNIKGNYFINIMEVCGTHTMAIAKYGISQLLPKGINLISGPGCPVCVTPINDIDQIIAIVEKYNLTVFTFGDMIRVPGSYSSLLLQKSKGKKIIVCYSPLDALEYAKAHPDENILFIAIGFETTAPLTAILVKKAYMEKLKIFLYFLLIKLFPQLLNCC